MGELRLICRVGYHHWHYSWNIEHRDDGLPYVLVTRRCLHCSAQQVHRTYQYRGEQPIWEEIKIA